MSRAPRVAAMAAERLARSGLLRHSYFRRLESGEMSLGDFRASQEQFFYAVQFYPRPMATLIARMPDPAQRLDLLHNIVEEHGDFRADQFHVNTFGKFLATIQGQRPDRTGTPVGPAVHAFNSALAGTCATDEIEVGVCCLGVIEQAFAGISASIGRSVVQRGWVAEKDLAHYALHAELDVRHAEDLFAIAEPRLDDAQGRVAIEPGLDLGIYVFDQLYTGLLLGSQAAAR